MDIISHTNRSLQFMHYILVKHLTQDLNFNTGIYTKVLPLQNVQRSQGIR